jgi:integrase
VLPEDKARVRLHDLRHSFASLALKKGVPLPTLSRMLGHRSIHMTMRYAHLCPDDRRLAAAAVGEAFAAGAVGDAKSASGGSAVGR